MALRQYKVVYVTIGISTFCFAKAIYSMLVTSVGKKSSVNQSELEK